ncbi:patatin-like phospholipase PlpD [Acidovorax lacteus]|uniref:Patatin-like phospholipase PlpD n=1 Tax=Acidovorax lacteus TaxID=1924988 RepID=A0ABP8L1B7_9BURK
MLSAGVWAQPAATAEAPVRLTSPTAQGGPHGVAPEYPVRKRPRVGLALSGGGARGAAHVGVLKVLESLRVPVDCVAGTSMGAVVGGAYAAGNSPEQMERLIAETDWSEVFVDRPPRDEISMRRKIDEYKPLFSPELGISNGRIQLPRGVVAGVTIEGFLRRLAAPASRQSQFSDLLVPYRAVAADITTGEAVVLSQGSLVQAMRASMAVPGAVAPVEIGDRLLVDGGIANNLPIDLVREMCADVVIAVNISTPPLRRDEITSALSIVGQLVNLLGKETVDRQIASLRTPDVLITPDLGTLSAASFERQPEAVAAGEAAALALADRLRGLALDEAAYQRFLDARAQTQRDVAAVDAIRFEGLLRTNEQVLSSLVQTRPGEPLSLRRLNADLRRVFGRGDFDAVDYRIDEADGLRTLAIPVKEKETGPDYLRLGLGLSSDFHGNAFFNVLMSHRRTWLNRYGGEWLTEAQLGRTNYLQTEWYQPVEPAGRFFVAPYAQWGRSLLDVFAADQRVASFELSQRRLGVDVGGVLGTWGEWRVGPSLRWARASLSTGFSSTRTGREDLRAWRAQLVSDTYDSAWFPRKGHRVALSATAGAATSTQPAYRRLEGYGSAAFSVSEHTLGVTLHAGSGLHTQLPVTEGFSLGGPLRLSAFQSSQFTGERMGFAMLRYYQRLQRLPSLLGSGVFVGGSLEAGRVDRSFLGGGSSGLQRSASLFVAAETFMGPAYLGLGLGPRGHRTLYLLIGVSGS